MKWALSLIVALTLIGCNEEKVVTIRYEIAGTSTNKAYVEYRGNDNWALQDTVSLPWMTTFKYDGDFRYNIMARNTSQIGGLTVKVYGNEELQDYDVALYPDFTAECSGTITY